MTTDRKLFEAWWAASKYCQVSYDTAGNEQIAWDGWRAARAMNAEQRNRQAIEIAVRYGGIDGAHHKDWVIDQMVRALAGNALAYRDIVATARQGDTYEWSEGIAP